MHPKLLFFPRVQFGFSSHLYDRPCPDENGGVALEGPHRHVRVVVHVQVHPAGDGEPEGGGRGEQVADVLSSDHLKLDLNFRLGNGHRYDVRCQKLF